MPRVLTAADIADFRGRLCDVAAALFVEVGENGFNMRELARRLGVSAMTPYRYFRDKESILVEVRVRAFAQFTAWLEASQAQGADPDRLTKAYLEFATQERTQYCLMFDFGQKSCDALAAAQGRLSAVFTDLAAALERQGRIGGDPHAVGVGYWALLHGTASLHFVGAVSGDALHPLVKVSLPEILSGLDGDGTPEKPGLLAFAPAMMDPISFQPAAE